MPHEDGEQARRWLSLAGHKNERDGLPPPVPCPVLVPPLSPDKGLKSPDTCLGLLLRLLRLGLLDAPWLTNAHRAIHLHRRSRSRRLFTSLVFNAKWGPDFLTPSSPFGRQRKGFPTGQGLRSSTLLESLAF